MRVHFGLRSGESSVVFNAVCCLCTNALNRECLMNNLPLVVSLAFHFPNLIKQEVVFHNLRQSMFPRIPPVVKVGVSCYDGYHICVSLCYFLCI